MAPYLIAEMARLQYGARLQPSSNKRQLRVAQELTLKAMRTGYGRRSSRRLVASWRRARNTRRPVAAGETVTLRRGKRRDAGERSARGRACSDARSGWCSSAIPSTTIVSSHYSAAT